MEAAILKIDTDAARLSLGPKEVLDTIKDRYLPGKVVEGKVTRIASVSRQAEMAN